MPSCRKRVRPVADDRDSPRFSERDRIDVSSDNELKYWIQKLDCTETELREAIERVGPLVRDVVPYLAQEKTNR
jgi:hypothetical protein